MTATYTFDIVATLDGYGSYTEGAPAAMSSGRVARLLRRAS